MSETTVSHDQTRHPIQVVSHRTGLSKDVIRIWERRYKVIEPSRSASGRRIYADAHIDRLLKLKEATGGGRPIGDVAHLSSQELEELLESDRQSRVERVPDPSGWCVSEESHAARWMAAIEALDPIRLEARLAAAAYGPVIDETRAIRLTSCSDISRTLGGARAGVQLYEHEAPPP